MAILVNGVGFRVLEKRLKTPARENRTSFLGTSCLLKELLAEVVGSSFMIGMGLNIAASIVLSKGSAGNVLTGIVGWAVNVTFAIMISGGGHLNPAITIAFNVLGITPWYKFPLYFIAQLFGAMIGSAVTYGIYFDAIQEFDGGLRQYYGPNATATVFVSFPQEFISNSAGFGNEVAATFVLLFCVMALIDERNMNIPKFFVPFLVGLLVMMISCSYCYNTGCNMNPVRDLGPRLFLLLAGWGTDTFCFRNCSWFLVPIFGPCVGAILGVVTYKLCIGLHWSIQEESKLNSKNEKNKTNTRLASP